MKKKEIKKLKQIYQRDYRQMAEARSKLVWDIFKPKPKWVPIKVWMFFLKIFIKI